jgi:hypothetical protein
MRVNDVVAGLSRGEWNAAYFLGLEAVVHHRVRCTVSRKVHEGVRILSANGYRFRQRAPAGGHQSTTARSAANLHERYCKELASGTFDTVGRARCAVRWLKAKAPQVDTRWLEELLETYDPLHPAPSGKSAPGFAEPGPSSPPLPLVSPERDSHG